MKLVCISAFVVAMASAPTQETEERRVDSSIRRFVSVYDWAIQDSRLRPRLERVIQDTAKELRLDAAARQKLLMGLSNTLDRYRIEQATAWALPKNADLVNEQAWSLKSSTYLVELSAAWRDLFKASLSGDQFKSWVASSVKRNESERARLTRIALIKRKKREVMRFRGAPTDGVSRLADAVAFGGFRRRSGSNLQQYLVAARRDVVKRGERARAATRLEYEVKIMELDVVCSLTPQQKKKLSLLIKGVVAKRHAETDRLVDAYLEHLKEPKTADAAWGRRLRDLQPRPSEDKSHRVFWDRMRSRILRDDQKKLLATSLPE